MEPVWFSIKDPERIDSLDHTARPYSSDSFSRAHHGGSSWRLTPRSEGETWALSAGLFQGSFRALSGLFQGSFSRAHHGGSSRRLITEAHHGGSPPVQRVEPGPASGRGPASVIGGKFGRHTVISFAFLLTLPGAPSSLTPSGRALLSGVSGRTQLRLARRP